eukprot:1138302-Pelagomonas_calceolata.AAC.3
MHANWCEERMAEVSIISTCWHHVFPNSFMPFYNEPPFLRIDSKNYSLVQKRLHYPRLQLPHACYMRDILSAMLMSYAQHCKSGAYTTMKSLIPS